MQEEDCLQTMSTAERRNKIYEIITQKKAVGVTDLSKLMDVSEMTIRRDFCYLEKMNLVERTHGGAVLSVRYNIEPLFSQKKLCHQKEKDAIAQKAVSFVQDYDTILLNSGTTTMRIFSMIKAKHVKIITNNPCIPFNEISENIEIISTGGILNMDSYTYVGDITDNTISNTWASKLFLGIDGIDIKHGLTTPVQQESSINRLMIEHTRGQIIVVADSSKIGKVSAFTVAPIKSINTLITDNNISQEDYEALVSNGIVVIRV